MYQDVFLSKYNYSFLVCCFTETVQRNEDKSKQKKETALLQDEQRKLAKNIERQSTDLHSQIVAAQS